MLRSFRCYVVFLLNMSWSCDPNRPCPVPLFWFCCRRQHFVRACWWFVYFISQTYLGFCCCCHKSQVVVVVNRSRLINSLCLKWLITLLSSNYIVRHIIKFTICWYTFKNILILITDENENCFKTTVLIENQCTWTVRNQVSTFLSLVNKDLPVKKMYLQQIFIIFEREPISNV